MSDLYLGMISGTSVDGVDAVLLEIDEADCRVRRAHTTPYPADLHGRVRQLIETPQTSLRDLGAVDHAVGRFFATCALDLLEEARVRPAQVSAIGHHGQTVFHQPMGDETFSTQIGDPNIVAALTGIATVADFRRLDMAHGGQGAPLVPAFHAWRFSANGEPRVIVNIGGIGNITALAGSRPPTGFDTGPGNTLLDLWVRRCRDEPFDNGGRWSASGQVDPVLLHSFLTEPFFAAPAPKSTGRELFHMAWLERHLASRRPNDVDVQATLAELTATTIATAAGQTLPGCRHFIVCGGGAHNPDLLARLRRISGGRVESTEPYGLAPDWVEGAAFAWLARARMRGIAGNVPSVTGARRPVVLGGVYWGAAP